MKKKIRYKSEKYQGKKERCLPQIKNLASIYDSTILKNLMRYLNPSIHSVFSDYVEKVRKYTYETNKDMYSKFKDAPAYEQEKAVIFLLKINEKYRVLLSQFRYTNDMTIHTTMGYYYIVNTHWELKNSLYKEIQKKDCNQNICKKLKEDLENTELTKMWNQILQVVKTSLPFSETTTNLNILEKELFKIALTGKNEAFDPHAAFFENYSPYSIVYAIINILNYPTVPYLSIIITDFEKDKNHMFLPGKDGKKRIKNPLYDSRVDEEQAYHLWLAVQNNCKQKDPNQLDNTIKITKEDLFQVFIQYGSVDQPKFNRIINNSKRFFQVENDSVIVFNTRTLLENFGYGPDTIPKQYHRLLPSRRLFRYGIIYTLAERDYIETKDLTMKAEEEKNFGFVEDTREFELTVFDFKKRTAKEIEQINKEKRESTLVPMPHGRSSITIAKNAKVPEVANVCAGQENTQGKQTWHTKGKTRFRRWFRVRVGTSTFGETKGRRQNWKGLLRRN